VERLRTPIRTCLAGESEFLDLTLDATNRRGRGIQVRVTCTPLTSTPPETARGVILVMEELNGRP
jgi:two-component system CheB/CheR fusion protein